MEDLIEPGSVVLCLDDEGEVYGITRGATYTVIATGLHGYALYLDGTLRPYCKERFMSCYTSDASYFFGDEGDDGSQL